MSTYLMLPIWLFLIQRNTLLNLAPCQMAPPQTGIEFFRRQFRVAGLTGNEMDVVR